MSKVLDLFFFAVGGRSQSIYRAICMAKEQQIVNIRSFYGLPLLAALKPTPPPSLLCNMSKYEINISEKCLFVCSRVVQLYYSLAWRFETVFAEFPLLAALKLTPPPSLLCNMSKYEGNIIRKMNWNSSGQLPCPKIWHIGVCTACCLPNKPKV